jgi:pimeloyl-ACP methyl ester carboxylesterase
MAFPSCGTHGASSFPVVAEAGYHAVAPDLRGCGETDVAAADESYAVSSMAADVIGLLDALDAEQAVLVGHDWGATINWACAELYRSVSRHRWRSASAINLGRRCRPRRFFASSLRICSIPRCIRWA